VTLFVDQWLIENLTFPKSRQIVPDVPTSPFLMSRQTVPDLPSFKGTLSNPSAFLMSR